MAVTVPRVRGKVRSHRQCFDLLDDYILSIILEMVKDPTDRLSVRLVCKRFLTVQANSRHKMQVVRTHILHSALQRYKELRHLDLSLCLHVQDKDLGVVGSITGPRLRAVSLSSVAGFTKLGLMYLASQCVVLKELDFSNCLLLGDEEMYVIALMVNLEVLKLTKCRSITDTGLIEVAKGCANLQVLKLKSCSKIADASITAVAEHCKLLEDLDLSYTEVTGVGFLRAARLKNLKTLTVVGCAHLDNDEALWPACRTDPFMGWNRLARESLNLRNLEVIKLDECAIVGHELRLIGKGPVSGTLKELSLSKCTGVTDEGVYAVLKGCPGLQRLDLTCCDEITDKTMWVIAHFCKQLRSLSMESCSLVTEHGIAPVGMYCPLLEELNLTDCKVNDQGLEKLANCKLLRILKVAYCLNITDVGLQYIGAACGDLREIDLYRSSEVGDGSLEALANGCPNLSVINMSYCSKLTDASLYSLAKLHELRSLEMRSLMKVTCDGVEALACGCRKLEKLDLKRCLAVTDWGIKALAENCLHLRQICLSYCWMVTDEGLEAITKSECMQNMSLLHLEVGVRQLEAALLSCPSLLKVKISAHLRQQFSDKTCVSLEKRGCKIKWLEKPSLDHLLLYPSQ